VHSSCYTQLLRNSTLINSMNHLPKFIYARIAFIGILIAFFIPRLAFSAVDNTACLACHSAKNLVKSANGTKVSVYVDTHDLSSSPHAKVACVDCHWDLKNTSLPHKTNPQPARCISCHNVSHIGYIHAGVAQSKNPPKCQDCHGGHRVLSISDSGSPVNPKNSEALCTKCHTDAKTINAYKQSVHGATGSNGNPVAGCTDCHRAILMRTRLSHPRAGSVTWKSILSTR
jgi:hypothetical protein